MCHLGERRGARRGRRWSKTGRGQVTAGKQTSGSYSGFGRCGSRGPRKLIASGGLGFCGSARGATLRLRWLKVECDRLLEARREESLCWLKGGRKRNEEVGCFLGGQVGWYVCAVQWRCSATVRGCLGSRPEEKITEGGGGRRGQKAEAEEYEPLLSSSGARRVGRSLRHKHIPAASRHAGRSSRHPCHKVQM